MQLALLIVSAGDTQPEKRKALQVISELNEQYQGQLELLPSFSPDGAARVTLAFVWSETVDVLERSLQGAGETLLFQKSTRVVVDLTKRAEVLARLEAKERLDTLLSANRGTFKTVMFDEGSFWSVLERELRRVADKQLGVNSNLINLRPQLGGTYLTRPRLMNMLPDTPGHVVHLEAPYGNGKSVLAAQWAEGLELEGWRVLWVASGFEGSLRPLIVSALRIAADTPDALLREQLWACPTLLVIEDLTGEEDFGLILDDPKGLVLLASRTPLEDAHLLKLTASGRVTQFGANDLAFTLTEAARLTGDQAAGATLHAETLGWALPLHIASLTGSRPDPSSLLAGIRASLSGAAWRELLFLAALPYLPRSAAGSQTPPLVSKGFVQALETSFRLHPFIADIALKMYQNEVADAVAQEAERLPLLLQGEAFERVADFERLVGVLTAVEAELWRHAPTRLIHWDNVVKGLMSPRRHWAVGAAQQRLTNFEAAMARLFSALDTPGLSPDEQLSIMKELCVPLGVKDNPRGQELIERAELLLDAVEPELAARFLSNAALIHVHANDYERAIAVAERALGYYPADSPHKVAAEVNLALFRWDLHGDFDYRLSAQLATLERIGEMYAVQALGQCRDLGMFHWWLGDWEKARYYLEQARDGEAVNPAIGTEARAALAYLDGDKAAVRDLSRTARLFDNPYVSDMVSMYKILQELGAGELEQARRSYEQSPQESFAACAYARVLAEQGDAAGAVALLDSLDTSDRARRLYLTAARYLITRDETNLHDFLNVTTAGIRLLPGFIPAEALPDNPEFAKHYPIQDVLLSGRKDAILLRETDIPDLRLSLLGGVVARLFGEPLDLTDRQKQILTLLTLGLGRDEVAEAMWPEVDPKKQRNNLNVQLNMLRKVIEPWGVATYLFEDGLKRLAADYHELNAALAAKDAGLAYTLYQEPFAPGIDLFAVEEERGRLREEVVTLLFEASVSAPSTNAGVYLERVLELEPLHEEALQSLLNQLVRRGRRREARQRFEKFKERLHEEMGLEPLTETSSLLGL